MAALTLCLPVVANAQDNREGRQGRGGQRTEAPAQQAPAPQQAAPQQAAPEQAPPQGGPRAGQGGPRAGGGGFFGRANPNQAAQAPPPQAPNVQAAPNQPRPQPQPNVARERGRGAPDAAQLGPREGGGQGRVTENRDRSNDRNNDRGRDFRNDNRDRNDNNFRNDNRGRDFRDNRDRGRYFNFRGREYSAVRGPAYSYPRGFGYRRWDRGQLLPSVFLASPFFFDYGLLGLPAPPPGTRWVRNGPDALLVDVYNDRIVDVIYDAFY
jgi:Ni/Co efflux regulator RcnB